ncbi:hypothetical protein ACWD4L_20590 [Streptomyces sp. NPDC002596]
MLKPAQAEAILDGCARFDAGSGQWSGSVRYRLLFTTLSETGMQLGECLSLKHCDWHVGRDGTPFVAAVLAARPPGRGAGEERPVPPHLHQR